MDGYRIHCDTQAPRDDGVIKTYYIIAGRAIVVTKGEFHRNRIILYRVCALNMLFINIFHDGVARIQSKPCLIVLLIRSIMRWKFFIAQNQMD